MAQPDAALRTSVAAHWNLPEERTRGFANARSALASLVAAVKPRRALLPAYICRSAAQAFSSFPILYYPVGNSLKPDIAALENLVQPGDMVLGVNYFGRAPDHDFCDFIRNCKDIVSIEDSAHALDTNTVPWGSWRLFSPRKLFGVADGGYIASGTMHAPDLVAPETAEEHAWIAPRMRAEDTRGTANSQWHAANQKHELSLTVSAACISSLSHDLLQQLDAPTIIQRRKENFAMLHQALASVAFIASPTPDFCPSGFPIRLDPAIRDRLRSALIAQDIFPIIHWADLPSPAAGFPAEHALAKELLTLPCDQRYSKSDMQRIAAAVLKELP